MTKSAHSSVDPRDTWPWFRRRPRLALSLLVVVGTLIVDFAAGSVLHAAGVTLPAMMPDIKNWVPHPLFHHALRQSAAYEGMWGNIRYKMYTNSLAMKDASVRDVPLRSEARRILFLGDSFTEGVGMVYEDSFAGMLARRFAGARVEFLNGGVASYSPALYIRKIKYLIDVVGLKVDHVSVAIDMSDIGDEIRYHSLATDPTVDSDHDISASKAFKQFLARHTVLIGALRMWIRAIREGTEEKVLALNQRKCRWANDEGEWKSYGERGMTLAIQHMNELHDYLMSKSIGLNIMIYPWPDQIMLRDLAGRQVQTWTAWAREHNVDLINLFPEFIGSLPPKETIKRYFIRGDIHWNKTGHALASLRLEEYFRKLKLR